MGVCLRQPSEALGYTEQTLILVVIMWVRGCGISWVEGMCWGGSHKHSKIQRTDNLKRLNVFFLPDDLRQWAG